MAKTYRVILIDPQACHIRELQSDATLATIHELVGADTLDHATLAARDGGGFDTGWLADDGLTAAKPVHAFLLPVSKDPFAGRCLIVGCDRCGETADAVLPLAVLQRDLTWLGLILPEVTWEHTEIGSRAIVTYSRVKAGPSLVVTANWRGQP
jgi:hypothetical protein